MSIWKFFGLEGKTGDRADAATHSSSAETETVRKIVKALDELDPGQARYIAAFAYLLGRVAYADHHISEDETREMERIIMQRGGLPEEQAILVVQIAKTQNQLFGGTENFLVSREFGKLAEKDQKISLLRALFAVCSADRSISAAEDHQIRQISRELLLSHEEFIAVRLEFREYLAVLKDLPGSAKT